MTWGPFLPGLDARERKARLRSLRACLHLIAGPRGRVAGMALLRAEISGDQQDTLHDAAEAFERLTALDRRRVLSAFLSVSFLYPKVIRDAAQ